ncbi:MAG: hypothetical protein ACSLFL_06260 [Alphaproteobacteria bacterium]
MARLICTHLIQIETRKRKGRGDTLRALAKMLGPDVYSLLDG